MTRKQVTGFTGPTRNWPGQYVGFYSDSGATTAVTVYGDQVASAVLASGKTGSSPVRRFRADPEGLVPPAGIRLWVDSAVTTLFARPEDATGHAIGGAAAVSVSAYGPDGPIAPTDPSSATFVPAQPTAPNPAVNPSWLDTTTSPPSLKVWNGAWIVVSGPALTPSTATVIRATSGAPTVLVTDGLGDFAVDSSAALMYGPLTGTPVPGQPWINGGTSGAAITTLGTSATQTITASGTLTAGAAGVYEIGVVAGGGGGGGGGHAATTGTQQTGAGGGGCGITSVALFTLTAAQVITFAIGAGGGGGAGGATGANPGIVGTDGGNSTATGTGVSLAAGGGGGGQPSVATSTAGVNGGVPGVPAARGGAALAYPGCGGSSSVGGANPSGGALGRATTGGAGGGPAQATGGFQGGSGGAAGAYANASAAQGVLAGNSGQTQGGDGGSAAANSGGGGGGGGGANGANRSGNGGTGGSGFGWMRQVG